MNVFWTTADGREIPISELTNEHLLNIFKYTFSVNRCPGIQVFAEASRRKLLNHISSFIPTQPGYKSPGELMTEVHKFQE